MHSTTEATRPNAAQCPSALVSQAMAMYRLSARSEVALAGVLSIGLGIVGSAPATPRAPGGKSISAGADAANKR